MVKDPHDIKCVSCTKDIKNTVSSYYNDFKCRNELVGFLEIIDDLGVDRWLDEIEKDIHTKYYCLFRGDDLISMFRITPEPRFEANGMIGYSIRPSDRGKGYSSEMIYHILQKCKTLEMNHVTACVDVNNVVSAHVLESNGFYKTGRSFSWIDNRNAIEYAIDI